MHRNAVDGKLDAVIAQIVAQFGANEDETRLLNTARRVRNKLLHRELNQVTKNIEPLTAVLRDVQPQKGQVWSLALDTGEMRSVSDTTAQDDSIFGWMLESALSGAFEGVVKVMEHAQEILLRLRDKLYSDSPGRT